MNKSLKNDSSDKSMGGTLLQKTHIKRQKRTAILLFTAFLFIIIWIRLNFASAIAAVLLGLFVYYSIAMVRHQQYRTKNGLIASAIFIAIGIVSSLAPNTDQSQNASSIQQSQSQQSKADEVKERERLAEIEASKPVIKTETKVEAIAHESVDRNDSSIALGERRQSVAGINGERTITYEVTYVKGTEIKRTETKNEVTTPPVSQVTLVGTYVKPTPAPAVRSNCDPNYSGCVPNVSYDLDCADIGVSVTVIGTDRHRFDRDNDGYGCESY